MLKIFIEHFSVNNTKRFKCNVTAKKNPRAFITSGFNNLISYCCSKRIRHQTSVPTTLLLNSAVSQYQ